MERLECKNENWYVNDEVSGKWVTKMMLPDFRGDTKECIHMRGKGWRWLILRCDYTGLKKGQEYEFAFWGKFDYYSGYGTVGVGTALLKGYLLFLFSIKIVINLLIASISASVSSDASKTFFFSNPNK